MFTTSQDFCIESFDCKSPTLDFVSPVESFGLPSPQSQSNSVIDEWSVAVPQEAFFPSIIEQDCADVMVSEVEPIAPVDLHDDVPMAGMPSDPFAKSFAMASPMSSPMASPLCTPTNPPTFPIGATVVQATAVNEEKAKESAKPVKKRRKRKRKPVPEDIAAERRKRHNQVEIARRKRIAGNFKHLRSLTGCQGTTKGDILEATIAVVERLQAEVQHLRQQQLVMAVPAQTIV